MTINYDLSRFVAAHQRDYRTALAEIKSGKKTSHWMWYIFPQLEGLGRSSMSAYYAVKDAEEARAFLADPYLGSNLREICEVLCSLETCDALRVFGSPDNMKLRFCMTLFEYAGGEEIFCRVIDTFVNSN